MIDVEFVRKFGLLMDGYYFVSLSFTEKGMAANILRHKRNDAIVTFADNDSTNIVMHSMRKYKCEPLSLEFLEYLRETGHLEIHEFLELMILPLCTYIKNKVYQTRRPFLSRLCHYFGYISFYELNHFFSVVYGLSLSFAYLGGLSIANLNRNESEIGSALHIMTNMDITFKNGRYVPYKNIGALKGRKVR